MASVKLFLLYLDKLCDEALGNAAASLCSEMVPHHVSQCSDSTGGNGDLEEDQNNMHRYTMRE